MLESHIRPIYQRTLVDPLARVLCPWSFLSANRISIISGVLGLFVLAALALGHPWMAVGFLWLSGYLDTLDGTLARMRRSASPFGSVLDIFADRVVEASCVIGLYLMLPASRGFLCLLMLSSILLCITSFLVVGVFSENESHKSFHYSPGLMERAEAFIFFTAMILLPHYFVILSLVFSALVLWTGIARIRAFGVQARS